MYLHVGLGNPGREYKLHRHNVGFMAIDSILEKYNIETGKEKFNGYHYIYSGAKQKIVFLKPQTYMNNSGRCVSAMMNFFSIEPSSVIVWHDEIDLDKGKIKVKWGGGHGGHNGVRDIISHIGNDFCRIRIGIGRPTNRIPPSKWVLSSFHRNDFNEWLNELLSVMANETELLHNSNSVEFMNKVAINTNTNKGIS